ncbi:MAG: hypothetical protein Q8K99_11045 [Actinomycetota bacterium]|nr:hypothetical protein [Actinomycetota bacterium]
MRVLLIALMVIGWASWFALVVLCGKRQPAVWERPVTMVLLTIQVAGVAGLVVYDFVSAVQGTGFPGTDFLVLLAWPLGLLIAIPALSRMEATRKGLREQGRTYEKGEPR